jgi:hypothetical protein
METDDMELANESRDALVPNTLAWAARAYDKSQSPNNRPWKVFPFKGLNAPVFQPQVRLDLLNNGPGESTPNDKEYQV